MDGSDGCVFNLLEYVFCLIKQTRLAFTPQIQIVEHERSEDFIRFD
jgi:hypothetical protein